MTQIFSFAKGKRSIAPKITPLKKLVIAISIEYSTHIHTYRSNKI